MYRSNERILLFSPVCNVFLLLCEVVWHNPVPPVKYASLYSYVETAHFQMGENPAHRVV